MLYEQSLLTSDKSTHIISEGMGKKDILPPTSKRLEMESDQDVRRDQLRDGHVNKEALPEISEDFFYGLNPEEKECLEYFLQTINTLDGEILKDDDEETHEDMAECLGSKDQTKSTVDSRMQESTSLEVVPAKPVSPHPATFTIKTTGSLPEESGDITLRSKPDANCPKGIGPHRPTDSPAVHLRKFDTIMRSGVNVQELRSRFLLHHDSSTNADRETTEDIAGTIKQLGPLLGDQKTAKDGGL
ncbi:hypothetical protein JD844_013249 [Phrynosoma platyrhinos]|uniref:Uncharacterized protein n=1 Tax=Phrynosoma platyrhinos TaxID=52577 RepID=A0ABQ7TLI7_PHRPL|nr:hypothetical protein JD844_013249 [Phrynosoma platyrhinos]